MQISTPGVTRADRFLRTPVELPTGVPAFVGFGQMSGGLEPMERADQFVQRFSPPAAAQTFLPECVSGFFANGGTRCYVLAVGDIALGAAGLCAALIEGAGGGLPTADASTLASLRVALGELDEVDLVAVPDAMSLSDDGKKQVQAAMIDHCNLHGMRFALLDAPRVDVRGPKLDGRPELDPLTGLHVVSSMSAFFSQWINGGAGADPGIAERLTTGGTGADSPRLENAAFYFPWVAPLGAAAGGRVPPSGHVAGIIARSDAAVGVFKAPANEELVGAVDVDFLVDGALQGQLNPIGVNCLRVLPGRGLRLYGARTLSAEPQWRYVNVRRLLLTLARWIDRHMTWATFEPNTERLWVRVRRELGTYLERLWRSGALQGQTADEAFFVRCDSETNPSEVREQGQVVTDVGLAPALPAEFIVVRITQRAGSTEFV